MIQIGPPICPYGCLASPRLINQFTEAAILMAENTYKLIGESGYVSS
jgi:hypothetical protein